jgi:hypothetical protein
MIATPQQMAALVIRSIRKWSPEQKAAARAHLNSWHAATVWEEKNPRRPYAKEFRN